MPALLIVVVLAALVVGGFILAGTGDDGPEISAGGSAGGTTPAPVDAGTTVAPTTSTTGTTTTTSTTSTTSTTTTPTTTPDPNAVALSSLVATIDADRPIVDTHLGRWVPQISAKREGLLWEGVTYDLAEIDTLHQSFDTQYGALLISGAEYNFRLDGAPMVGWYVSVVDQSYPTPEGALSWCRTAGIDRENCAAKLITNDPDAGETLVLQ